MNVIVISESRKKAWVRTRRIVSQYLPQCGSQVWMGSIDEEGLHELKKELQRHATRNMSVICHVITSRVTQKIGFIVGSRKNFDEYGHFVFSCTKQQLPREIPKKELSVFLSEITRLAGLLHDLGKSVVSFQRKIRGRSSSQADPARHERLSAHICCKLLQKHKESYSSEDEILDLIASFPGKDWNQLIERVLEEFDQSLRSRTVDSKSSDQMINNYLQGPSPKSRGKRNKNFPVFTVLIQLVLSHHFLPYTELDDKNARILEKRYIHGYSDQKGTDAKDDLRTFGTPVWRDEDWLARVKETINSILDLKSRINLPEISTLLLYSFLLARPALVAADQSVSARGKQKKYKDDPDNICFATPYDIDSGEMAQPLSKHLVDVGRYAARNMEWLDLVWQGHRLDYVNGIPSKLKSKKELSGSFAWQETAQKIAQKIRSGQNKSGGDFGFFGVMSAATGTGKTRCIPRFMSHLQGEGNIRFTLSLGLRTLTEQSGKDYVSSDEIGFQENQEAAVLIGGEFQDFSRERGNVEYQQDVAGDAEMEERRFQSELADRIYGDTYIDFDSNFPSLLAGPQGESSWNSNNQKLAKMLQVPVLVCTVDHLMAGLTNPKSDASKRLTRILTSDLVIDEIDSFAIEDLQGLARLIFLTGAAGRKVILSSATISATLCRYLFQAYLRGYRQYCGISPGVSKTVCSAWLSHIPDLCGFDYYSIDSGDDTIIQDYYTRHHRISKAMTGHLESTPVQRKLDYLDLSDCRVRERGEQDAAKSYQIIAQRLDAEINRLHESFKIENRGSFLSVGLLRFSQTNHALQVFDNLADHTDMQNTKRVYVFYQSNLTDVNLEKVEEVLNRILKRKHHKEEIDPIWFEPEIEKMLSLHPDISDFQLVVVSTPIEEVGRDHDFDYAIIEPTSIWSTVQIAGRVSRHREHKILDEYDPANIIMLSHPLRDLITSGNIRPYSGPGPVDRHHDLSSYDAREIFPVDMQSVVDARYALDEDIKQKREKQFDSMAELEKNRVIHDIGSKISLEQQGDPLLDNWLTHVSDFYDKKFPFRDSRGRIDLEVSLDQETPKCRYLDKQNRDIILQYPFDRKNKEKYLLNYSKYQYEKSGKFTVQVDRNVLDQILTPDRKSKYVCYSDETGGVVL